MSICTNRGLVAAGRVSLILTTFICPMQYIVYAQILQVYSGMLSLEMYKVTLF